MATFTFTAQPFAPGEGFNMLDLSFGTDPFDASGATYTPTAITAPVAGGLGELVISGTGLTYERMGGDVVGISGGRITGIDLEVFGSDVVSITGLTAPARAASDFIERDAGIGLIRLLTAGNDRINGSANADTLYGGAGRDVIAGGDGADRFVFLAQAESGPTAPTRDVIADFDVTEDRINLRAIDANLNVAGNQNFTYLDTGAFTAAVGEVRIVAGTGFVVVLADTDGRGGVDFSLRVNGTSNLDLNDFIL